MTTEDQLSDCKMAKVGLRTLSKKDSNRDLQQKCALVPYNCKSQQPLEFFRAEREKGHSGMQVEIVIIADEHRTPHCSYQQHSRE